MSSHLDWDDLCFDPHQASVEEGHIQGRKAGELAGFQDGRALGQTKGLELGMELGFARGCYTALRESSSSSPPNTYSERVQKSLEELRKALDDFPSSSEIFTVTHEQTKTTSGSSDRLGADADDTEQPSVPDDNGGGHHSKLDVVFKMQRIRARLKLLTVQLGLPAHSMLLKHVMDQAAEQGEGEERDPGSSQTTTTMVGAGGRDNEW